MLVLISIWIFLSAITYLCGSLCLQILRVNLSCFEETGFGLGSVFVVLSWIGTISLSLILLFISLFVPISFPLLLSISFVLAVASLSYSKIRASIRKYFRKMSVPWLSGLLLIIVLVGYISTAKTTFYDSGLYHFQVIQWLSSYGTVPGLALLHNRFGFTSIWFALASPFNAGLLEKQALALTGGFALFLSLTQLASCIYHVSIASKNKSLQAASWFYISAMFFYLPYSIRWSHIVTASPDPPVDLLAIQIVWLILAISLNVRINTKEPVSAHDDEKSPALFNVDITIIPLLLATGAMAIKLSALPLVVVTFVFYCFYRFTVESVVCRFFNGLMIISLIISPILVVNLFSSGCPLYPSSIFCTNLPWSVGSEDAHKMSVVIRDWARWVGPLPKNANELNWFTRWLGIRVETTFLIIVSFASLIGLSLTSKKSRLRYEIYLYAMGIIGIVFMIYKAPDPRFGISFLIILPCLAIARLIQKNYLQGFLLLIFISSVFYLLQGKIDGGMMFPVYISVLCLSALNIWFVKRKTLQSQFLFLPILLFLVAVFPHSRYLSATSPNLNRVFQSPKMRTLKPPKLMEVEASNFTYYRPAESGQCWASPLPCTPYLTYADVGLRNLALGLGNGFQRERQN